MTIKEFLKKSARNWKENQKPENVEKRLKAQLRIEKLQEKLDKTKEKRRRIKEKQMSRWTVGQERW